MDVGVGGCMRYFGIRSYLDNFYDRQGDNERERDIQHRHINPYNRPRFSSRWWKIILWIGTLLVLSGLFLLLIGFMLPRKNTNVDEPSSSNPEFITVDRDAIAYNSKLDRSHSIGICLVVAGGILFTLSLLLPTFCHMWCASGDATDETDPLKFRMETSSGSEQTIPVRSVPKSVQPNYRKNESRITTDGMTPITSP
ncbi:unnamed protein product [Adineta steineri]|uniref:Uncharacterized protein n=1 Tax=Adineta steineri TaxID=433720 RepID=A0A814BRU8_9BILA|nr:unnamed protein product [Adineta steineri]CAF1445183.1 unnamed protein product [Adineta steineri]